MSLKWIFHGCSALYHWHVITMIAGGQMTTLKGEDIDYSGTPVNKGGLVASVGVDHKALQERLPNWDPDKHWETQTEPLIVWSNVTRPHHRGTPDVCQSEGLVSLSVARAAEREPVWPQMGAAMADTMALNTHSQTCAYSQLGEMVHHAYTLKHMFTLSTGQQLHLQRTTECFPCEMLHWGAQRWTKPTEMWRNVFSKSSHDIPKKTRVSGTLCIPDRHSLIKVNISEQPALFENGGNNKPQLPKQSVKYGPAGRWIGLHHHYTTTSHFILSFNVLPSCQLAPLEGQRRGRTTFKDFFFKGNVRLVKWTAKLV